MKNRRFIFIILTLLAASLACTLSSELSPLARDLACEAGLYNCVDDGNIDVVENQDEILAACRGQIVNDGGCVSTEACFAVLEAEEPGLYRQCMPGDAGFVDEGDIPEELISEPEITIASFTIDDIIVSKSDCETGGLIQPNSEYCIRKVEIILSYEASVQPENIICYNRVQDTVPHEVAVNEKSGSHAISITSDNKSSIGDPSTLALGTYCYLYVDEETTLLVTNEVRHAELPLE